MVKSVLIALQVSSGERGVTEEDFIAPLQIEPDDPIEAINAEGGRWQSGVVYFSVIRRSAFADETEPDEVLTAAVQHAFLKVSAFLDRRSPDIFSAMRDQGLSLQLYIEVRMDQDQMELELPSELLAACARHRLGVYLISNDIPVSDVLGGGTV